MFKTLSRKLFGKNFSKLFTSLLASLIIYLSLSQIGYKLSIAPQVLAFINLFFSGTLMIQFLSSKSNGAYLKGFFAMPFNSKRFVLEYATVMGLHVLVTKTLLVYAMIFAFAKVSFLEIAVLLSSYIFVCSSAMLAYAFFKRKKILSVLIVIIAIAMCFLLPECPMAAIIYLKVSIIYALALFFVDPYNFMVTLRSKSKSKPNKKVKGGNLLVPKYIFRYMTSNKSYLISPAILLAFVSFMVYNMMNSGFSDGLVMGLALITFNTPLAIIVSSCKGLHKKLNSIPNKIKSFYLPYGVVIFIFNLTFSALLIIVASLLGCQINIKAIFVALAFPIQNAIGAVFLEYNYPILEWRVETDLWHNPRKYIIPAILVLESAIFMIL